MKKNQMVVLVIFLLCLPATYFIVDYVRKKNHGMSSILKIQNFNNWEPQVIEDLNLEQQDFQRDVLFHFWASWCAPCQQEFPLLVNYMAKNPDKKIIAINVDKDISAGKRFLTKYLLPKNWVNVFDSNDFFFNFFQVGPLPETRIYRNSYLLKVHQGMQQWNQ